MVGGIRNTEHGDLLREQAQAQEIHLLAAQ